MTHHFSVKNNSIFPRLLLKIRGFYGTAKKYFKIYSKKKCCYSLANNAYTVYGNYIYTPYCNDFLTSPRKIYALKVISIRAFEQTLVIRVLKRKGRTQ